MEENTQPSVEIKDENAPVAMPVEKNNADPTTAIYIVPQRKSFGVLESRIAKVFVIIGMLLVLQIPLLLVSCQVENRAERQQDVKNEIIRSWGYSQQISCVEQPAKLIVDADISTQIRHRGIYQVPVYTAKVKLNALYDKVTGNSVKFRVADPSAINDISAKVNGKDVKFEFEAENNPVIVVPVDNSVPADVKLDMQIRGSEKFLVNAAASHNEINIRGDWNAPGFIGSKLPETRSVDENSFSAQWNINRFGKSFDIPDAGVDLCIAAGCYQQVERTLKYATFFLIIFFFTMFIGEIISKNEIHPVQYVIAAGAPVLFYLMLLAVAEHTTFNIAYIISAAVIVAMVTAYAKMFMGRLLPALVMGGVFAASYVVNFFILQLEDFALLGGTIILAVILGVLMSLTGNINRKKADSADE